MIANSLIGWGVVENSEEALVHFGSEGLPFLFHVLSMLRVLPSWDARGARHKSFT